MIYREENNKKWTLESIGSLIYKFENSRNMTCRFEIAFSDITRLNQISDWCKCYGYSSKIDDTKNQVVIKKLRRNGIIKPIDINKFEKICDDLNALIIRIRAYEPSAHLYVTPSQINLMIGYGDTTNNNGNELKIADRVIHNLDCGDW